MPGAGRRRQRERRLEAPGNEQELPGKTLLAHDKPESVAPYIAELLDDAGIRVLIYAGDRDLTTNLQGTEKVLNGMKWSGNSKTNKEWKTADRYLWMVNGNVAGYVKTLKNLDMLLVLNSGHLVPYNVPTSALDLITRLTSDESFDDILLPKVPIPANLADEASIHKTSKSKKVKTKSPTASLDPNGLEPRVPSHKMFHAFLLLLVAVVCFACGVLAGAGWVHGGSPRTPSYTYQRVPDVMDGNNFQLESQITRFHSNRGSYRYKD